MSKASGKINAANALSADPAASPVPVPAPKPKPQERAAVEAWFDRRRQRAPAPRLKVEKKGGASQVALDHPHPETGSILLMAAVGTSSADFLQSLISQLVNAGSKGPVADEDGANFMLAVVTGIEPRDEVEAMLASQMAAVHMATMTFARRLNHVDTIPQQDSAERAFNKLARTFAMQVEALKRIGPAASTASSCTRSTSTTAGRRSSEVSPRDRRKQAGAQNARVRQDISNRESVECLVTDSGSR